MKNSSLATRQFERILLIKPSAFGDVLHAVPVLAKLRARYPAARIDWLITPENAELVRHHPALSNVVLFARRDCAHFGRSWSATAGLMRLLSGLWHTRYDLVIDLHGQLRSLLFTLASRSPVRIGFDRPRRHTGQPSLRSPCQEVGVHGWDGAREGSWLAYSHRIGIPSLEVHAVDRYLWLAPMLGLDDGPPDFRLYWPPKADDRAARLLEQHGLLQQPFALLVPGTIWQTKHWRIEGFAEVGRYLLRMGLAVAVTGTAGDRACCQAVVEACPGARNLSGQTTLAEFAAVVQQSVVSVTNDSGSMHLAAALGKPVISVFGPTDPVRVGPYGRPNAIVRADLPCAPCYLRKLRHCPHDHACMTQITAAHVIERLPAVLAGTKEPWMEHGPNTKDAAGRLVFRV